MKIKAFSFEQNGYSLATAKQEVVTKLNESGVYFEGFSDVNELFKEISAALENTQAILIGVEQDSYLKFKPILIKAFNFTPAYSEKIESAIGSTIIDEKLIKAHTLVPNECIELISSDGLYSSFYVKSADQYIVVFPLIEGNTGDVLLNSGLPFFKVPERKFKIYDDIASEEKASPKAESIVAKLVKNDLKLAIPSTPAAKALKDDIRSCPNYENNVYFTPYVNDSGVEDPKEYAAQLAKGAMDLRNADLGATVSNIFREKKGDTVVNYYSFISVATADKIAVKKLFANAGEDVDNLIAEATNELYSMIDKYVDEAIFKNSASEEEKEKYEQALIEAEFEAEQRPTASIGKKGTIAAIIALAIAVIVCVILGFKFGGYFVTPSDEPEKESVQAGNTVSNTAPSTTLGRIPEWTEKETTTKKSEITELASEEESLTSIFDVPATSQLTPVPDTNRPVINYTPNPNTAPATTQEQTTQEQTTKKPTPTTEKETMEIVEF
ncbi:MAG: hypothetical protein E7529_04370 [Ruminococcaceae bacterium]|nr:hypothetical protein [Oscillospiraceae bacterium]